VRASWFAEGLVESVAGAANGADWIAFTPLRQSPAQATDVRVDGSLVDLCGLTPHSVEQLGAREDSARLFQ
jgi:hypothetical protein